MKDRWRHVVRLLRAERPPSDMDTLYVLPPRSSAAEICAAFDDDPTSFQKFLLVGARGGGKSTELREVERSLDARATLVTVDLDASGVSPSALAAFDLLYVSGLALLRLMPENDRAAAYKKLTEAYAGTDASGSLGTVQEALAGLQSFADAAGAVTAVMSLSTGVPLVSAGLGVASKGLRLLGLGPRLVAEASPEGRRLQAACNEIARAVRAAPETSRGPICVLIDGLEKMNGEATSRFEQMFCQTRLLADTPWMMAIAAPPSSLTATHSARSVGYEIMPVYGFDADAPDDRARLVELLGRRFHAAGVDPARHLAPGVLDTIAEKSGGLPRQAIQIAANVVRRAIHDRAERIEPTHVAQGVQKEAETLGLGLTDEDFRVMARVHATHQLPGDERAAKLFADGRILAHPPAAGRSSPRFVVHPLLRPDVERMASSES